MPTYPAGFSVGRTNVNPENHATGRRPAGSRQSHAVHAGAQPAVRAHSFLLVRLFVDYGRRLEYGPRR